MGGRGAFIGYKNRAGHHNKEITDTFDQDSKTTKTTKISKTLEKKNFIVMKSTDKIPDEIFLPNMNKINKILEENPELYRALGKKKIYVRSEKFADPDTDACFDDRNSQRTQIIYNKIIFGQTRKKFEAGARTVIKDKIWTRSDENELVNHVIVHEFGHFVQRILIDKQARLEGKPKGFHSSRYDKKQAEKMLEDIENICYNKFHKPPKTSAYGTSDEYEFFAETFCELYTTKNPSYTAKALGIYLKEKLR